MTTVTVTEALKMHLKHIKTERDLDSFNDTILHVLQQNTTYNRDVADGNTMDQPGVISISEDTLQLLEQRKQDSPHTTYDDLLRAKSGATSRCHGEKPINWEPLDTG